VVIDPAACKLASKDKVLLLRHDDQQAAGPDEMEAKTEAKEELPELPLALDRQFLCYFVL